MAKKRKRKNISNILLNQNESVTRYINMASNFQNSRHIPKTIYDGIRRKKRNIIVPSNDEQVMHHMVVNILKPIFMKSMYEHSYGSIPGRGSHKARYYLAKWITYNPKDTQYCLQMDIKKFFDTIPLGFYTSQWLANFYLTDLDHFIKEQLKARYYVRYMDDMVILDSDKKRLHAIRIAIEKYLTEELGLNMKNNWQVFRIEYKDKYGHRHGRPLDYMGFKFYRERVTLRKSILKRMRRKVLKMSYKSKPTIRDCRQFLSYIGWMNSTKTYRYYIKYIKPYVNIGCLKRRISVYDKKRKECLCGKEVKVTAILI